MSDTDDLDVFDLALRLRWNSVVARVEDSPNDLLRIDNDGLSVLHWICCNPPADLNVVASLLRHQIPAKQACLIADHNSMTPLLCACSSGAPTAMIQALVDVCPESLDHVDRDGWNVLHFLCHRACLPSQQQHADIVAQVQMVVALRPQLGITKNGANESPLDILGAAYEATMFAPTEFPRQAHPFRLDEPFWYLNIGMVWQLAELLIEAAASHVSGSILHQVLSLSLRDALFALAWTHGGEETMSSTDNRGDTPLHAAVRHRNAWAARILVKLEPTAASRVNHADETPLQLAHRLGLATEVMMHLLRANVGPLEKLRLRDILYPNVLERVNSEPCLLFGILRGRPSLVKE